MTSVSGQSFVLEQERLKSCFSSIWLLQNLIQILCLSQDTTDEDSDFEEGYRRKTKPIMLKIKKEKVSDLGAFQNNRVLFWVKMLKLPIWIDSFFVYFWRCQCFMWVYLYFPHVYLSLIFFNCWQIHITPGTFVNRVMVPVLPYNWGCAIYERHLLLCSLSLFHSAYLL